MGKMSYEQNMRRQIQDFGFAIETIRRRLDEGIDNRTKVEAMAQIDLLEHRRDDVRHKLDDLESRPDGAMTDVRAELEQEWNDLLQDFEERLGALP